LHLLYYSDDVKTALHPPPQKSPGLPGRGEFSSSTPS